jgi:hypothetical protein
MYHLKIETKNGFFIHRGTIKKVDNFYLATPENTTKRFLATTEEQAIANSINWFLIKTDNKEIR